MKNERITENIFRDLLREKGYYDDKTITIEEQSSSNFEINKALEKASKKGTGKGKPEFIINLKKENIILVVECKSDTKRHSSGTLSKPADYAVDGVFKYAKDLSKSFNVFSIAISGEDKNNLEFSTFLWINGLEFWSDLKIENLLNKEEYISIFRSSEENKKENFKKIKKNTKEIHNILREKIFITDELKPIIISALLLALSDDTFVNTLNSKFSSKMILNQMLTSIRNRLESVGGIPQEKIDLMMKNYKSLESNEVLTSTNIKEDNFLNVILKVKNEIWPYIDMENSYDYLGEFYKEFLSYSDGNKKGLGIVLTPHHITELFCDLANLSENDIVFDPCCGTGGFLISAMNKMISGVSDPKKKTKIKRDNLVGIEKETKMFTLAASNMIIRGDGKSNLYSGNCFDYELKNKIKINHKPNIGFINPPYSQKFDGGHELDFIISMLEVLQVGGIGVAIIPINCFISPNLKEVKLREKILEKHTLLGVLSMPTNLFYPVGTVTAIGIFKANSPHPKGFKSWFANCKDDGFVLSRGIGRIDKNQKWKEISKMWINSWLNREEETSFSVKKAVTGKDEWCAEAYLEPDYSKISKDDLIDLMEDYEIFKMIFKRKKNSATYFEIGDEKDGTSRII
ncbi:SAM-dependent methyltransferase [Mesoplasma chauliocola]|uniref:site-specific DNA-methyltransferase (adenine-specific) n=1 Tax=Mesoplasma chauliocola TaxID=216427 RepID=A0A249SMZ7_9MOLU|nr:N-6 DNA methylase [Mesoplasma chauliocola]ASZ09054.1 SAM-dependent methyltransferase [Mesoplasma chauliocola]